MFLLLYYAILYTPPTSQMYAANVLVLEYIFLYSYSWLWTRSHGFGLIVVLRQFENEVLVLICTHGFVLVLGALY